MPASKALQGENPASRVRLANGYRIDPSASVAYAEAVTTGRAPPAVVIAGLPTTVGIGPIVESLAITITAGGALGTATWQIAVNGAAVFGGTTAPVIDLGPGGSSPLGIGQLYLFFAAGTYDTSNTYTYTYGTSSGVPDGIVAIGKPPIELLFGPVSTFTLTDSVLASVRNVSLATSPIIVFPAAPWDGMEIAVRDATQTAFSFPIILTGNTGQAVENPYQSGSFSASAGHWPLFVPGQCVTYRWSTVAAAWLKIADTADSLWPTMDAVNANVTVTGRALVHASSTVSSPLITLNTPVSQGLSCAVMDVGGVAGTTAIHVTAQSNLWAVENPTALGIPSAVSGGTNLSLSTNFVRVKWVADIVRKIWFVESYLP